MVGDFNGSLVGAFVELNFSVLGVCGEQVEEVT